MENQGMGGGEEGIGSRMGVEEGEGRGWLKRTTRIVRS